MENIIEIKNLKKHFGNIKAVDDISFDVEKSSLFAFLGINGAGKSTTINIICSKYIKDEGEVIVNGLNLDSHADEIKSKVGIVFQNGVLDDKLSVKNNLEIRASFYGLAGKEFDERLSELSKILELDEILNRAYGNLSGGQKRRADIARGLINKPDILFLDEPTTGLDPKTRRIVWNVIEKQRKESNMTVFLTTHYMEEASNADKVVIIDNGKIIATGTPNQLKNKFSGDYIKVYSKKNPDLENALSQMKYTFQKGLYRIKVSSSVEAKDFIIRNQNLINDFEVVKGDMDDVFMNATGKKLGGEQ